ncbi:MAG: Co2+/Mg2+ efflux protein ApaG [Gemmatimonadota bacterium]
MIHAETEGIRVSVRPVYSPGHSDPEGPRHVFVYYVRIENVGEEPARLRWRHWDIHDAEAGASQVEGEGVIGQQPLLEAGCVHEYNSYCVLRGTEGHMEGWYELERPDGNRFRAAIPRFHLRTDAAVLN